MAERFLMARWQIVNVLHTSASGRRIWQLSPAGDNFTVQGEKTLLLNEAIPPTMAAKDWQSLFRHKLNIAWLPADKVFLRAVQLPASEPAEIAQMIELQMEKLSPLPVAQMVWSFYLLPRPLDKPEGMQTVIVIVAARSGVEEFLGELEGEGYLADRLETPGLDQLLAADIQEDGVWIFPSGENEPVLAVWWYGGTAQNLTLVLLTPGPERGAQLKTQLEQIAWSGELDGWLTSAPTVHLVAGAADTRFWETVFKEAGQELKLHPAATEAQLAALSARRCVDDAANTSLLPREFAARYHQQFVDGLWMRGLVGVLSAYIIGVLIYFGALYVLKLKYNRVSQDLASISGSYTNALKDAEQIKILLDRQELKYKALDCLKAVAETMPESITLQSFYFQRGRVDLRGAAVTDDADDVGKFNEELRHVNNPNRPDQSMFSDITPPRMESRGEVTQWGFTCQLKEAGSE
ncbi:MAG TPA: hypothetical protein VMR33_14395 [Candidatus Baltobacteraceae bacterium]|jgi:hypothetical protein|nr:hypothetical protein [Candidatus Baltobacteraceae bacterium]